MKMGSTDSLLSLKDIPTEYQGFIQAVEKRKGRISCLESTIIEFSSMIEKIQLRVQDLEDKLIINQEIDDIKKELTEEIKKKVREEIKSELKEEIKMELVEHIRRELTQDFSRKEKEESSGDVTEDTGEECKQKKDREQVKKEVLFHSNKNEIILLSKLLEKKDDWYVNEIRVSNNLESSDRFSDSTDYDIDEPQLLSLLNLEEITIPPTKDDNVAVDCSLKRLEMSELTEKFLSACDFPFDLHVAKIAIDAGVDINAENREGKTALHVACGGCGNFPERVAIVDLLLKHPQIDINKESASQKTTPLYFACIYGQIDVIKMLTQDLRMTSLNSPNGYGTPLMGAVDNRNSEAVREMINVEGVDLQTRNSWGRSLIEQARRIGEDEIIKLLEEVGAD